MKGEFYWPEEDNKLSYIGEFKDYRMHGKGVLTWKDGIIYDGEFF